MRKLTVKKERLAELTTEDLVLVNAAAPAVPDTLKITCLPTVFGCTTARTCPRPS